MREKLVDLVGYATLHVPSSTWSIGLQWNFAGYLISWASINL
jgi:hypothetical protein